MEKKGEFYLKYVKITGLLFIIFALALVGCGSSQDDSGADSNEGAEETDAGSEDVVEGDTPDFLSMLTGGTSGTYYPLGGEMASIITQETGIQTDAVSSNASADNIMAVHNGEAELAFT